MVDTDLPADGHREVERSPVTPAPAPDRVAVAAAAAAVVLGTAHAAMSAYWAFGGSGLLDTVGGSIERWGRDRDAGVVLALAAITVVKLVVAVAAPILAGIGHPPAWATGRVPRALGWIAAVGLVLYGGLLTAVGILVQTGGIDPAADADRHALAWHTWFWDPWFLLWGAALATALWRTRAARADRRRDRRPGSP